MARILSPIAQSERESLKQLIACDPSGLKTLAAPVKANQGRLQFGTLMTLDGFRTLVPSQAVGILAHSVDTDLWEDGDVVTLYVGGRFAWKAIVEANPSIVFDPLTISGLRVRGLSFEAVYSGGPNQWISLP